MRRAFPIVFGITLLISLPAEAAYKCVVDGTVTYQERPCDQDVKKKGGETVIAPPPRPADLVGDLPTISKAESDRRKSLVKTELEPYARSAFAALKDGRMIEYRDMTCLSLRRSLTKPEIKEMFKREGESFTKRQIVLGKLEPSNVAEMMTFQATEVKDPSKTWHKPPEQLFVNISLAWEEGKLCANGISTWSKEIR
jgi:hypothetical protein